MFGSLLDEVFEEVGSDARLWLTLSFHLKAGLDGIAAMPR